MIAQMLTGIGRIEAVQVADPVIEGGSDVLLRIDAVGVCGSDVHYFETGRIGSQIVQFPFTVGHECAATVVEVGSGVTTVQPGQKVVVEPAVSCFACDQCKAGRPHTCRKLKFLGCPGQISGCLSEYIVMPAECCLPTRDTISQVQGVLCEPFAIGLYAVLQSGIAAGQSAAIFGAGPIGLSCLSAALYKQANPIYMTEKIGERIAVAQLAGAEWVGNPDTQDVVAAITEASGGVDIAFECAGQQETLDQAIEVLKPGGRLMMIGIPRQERVSFCPDSIRRKEISIVNVRRQNHCTQKAIGLLASGEVNLDYMVTHTFGFDKTAEAFDLVAGYRDGVVKAIIEFGK